MQLNILVTFCVVPVFLLHYCSVGVGDFFFIGLSRISFFFSYRERSRNLIFEIFSPCDTATVVKKHHRIKDRIKCYEAAKQTSPPFVMAGKSRIRSSNSHPFTSSPSFKHI